MKQLYTKRTIIHQNEVDEKRRLYCRKFNKIQTVSPTLCSECPYVSGSLQDHGMECAWEDYVPDTIPVVYKQPAEYELKRISKLIDSKVLPKVAKRTPIKGD